MNLSIKYSGDATMYTARYNSNSKKNLQKGNRSIAGKWGIGACDKFRSRLFYLFEHGEFVNYSFILTYRAQPTNKRTKRDINAFISHLKRHGSAGFGYTLEKTKAGVYHYHFVCNMKKIKNKNGVGGKQILNDAWCRIRGDYAKNAVRAIEPIGQGHEGQQKLAYYIGKLAQYASKHNHILEKLAKQNKSLPEQFQFDTNIRLWATSNSLVGKEKFVLDVTDYGYLINQARRRCVSYERITLENGYYFDKLFFNRTAISFFYQEFTIQQEIERVFKERNKKKQEKQENRAKVKLLTSLQLSAQLC